MISIIGSVLTMIGPLILWLLKTFINDKEKRAKATKAYYKFIAEADKKSETKVANYLAAEQALKDLQKDIKENKPMSFQDKFDELAYIYANDKRFMAIPDHLKLVTFAQAIIESGRGKSDLFKKYNNPFGMKFREELYSVAVPVMYQAHDGKEPYCHFTSLADALSGYWLFIGRWPYKGWEKHTDTAEDYIRYICEDIEHKYCPTPGYSRKVLLLIPEAGIRLGIEVDNTKIFREGQ